MAGRNSGWFSPTSVCFSTSHTRMTTLWQASLCWATLSPSHRSQKTSTRTTSSNSTSSLTSTTSDQRASTPLRGGWRWSGAQPALLADHCRAPGKTFTDDSSTSTSYSLEWRSRLHKHQERLFQLHKRTLIITSESLHRLHSEVFSLHPIITHFPHH